MKPSRRVPARKTTQTPIPPTQAAQPKAEEATPPRAVLRPGLMIQDTGCDHQGGLLLTGIQPNDTVCYVSHDGSVSHQTTDWVELSAAGSFYDLLADKIAPLLPSLALPTPTKKAGKP